MKNLKKKNNKTTWHGPSSWHWQDNPRGPKPKNDDNDAC